MLQVILLSENPNSVALISICECVGLWYQPQVIAALPLDTMHATLKDFSTR